MRRGKLLSLVAMLAVGACGESTPADPVDASIRVSVTGSGNAGTSAALSVRWNGSAGGTGSGQVSVGGSVTLTVPDVGSYTVEVSDLPDHCFTGQDQVAVVVVDGVPAAAAFDVSCVGGFAHVYRSDVLAYRGLDGSIVEHDLGGQVFPFEWDPTGRYLLFRRNSVPTCPLLIFDQATGSSTPVENSEDGYAGPEPVWAPDASRFAVLRTGGCSTNGAGDAVLLIDPSSGVTLDSIVGLASAPGLTWGPGPSQVTYTDENEIRIHDWDTGLDTLFATMSEDPQVVAWAPTGDVLAATIGSGPDIFLRLFDASGAEVAEYGGAGSAFERLRWAPDGSKLALNDNAGFAVVDRAGVEVFAEAAGAGFALAPRWAPDSGSLLFEGSDGGPSYIGWIDANGAGRTALSDDSGDDGEPSWAGGSSLFLYHGAGGTTLLLGEIGGPLRVPVSALQQSSFPRWRPNVTLDLN